MYQESVVQNHLVENKNTKMYPEKKERKKKDALKKKKTKDKKHIFFFSFRTRHMASKESQSRWYSRKKGNNASGSSQVHYLSLLR